jgi:hypothetical protein
LWEYELKKDSVETAMAYSTVESQHWSGRTEESKKITTENYDRVGCHSILEVEGSDLGPGAGYLEECLSRIT